MRSLSLLPFLVAAMATGVACSEPEPVPEPATDPELPEPSAEPAVAQDDPPAVEPEPGPTAPEDPEEAPEEPDPLAAAPAPVPGESPPQAVARCEATDAFEPCLVRALDERDEMRARERELLITAHETMGNRERAIHHMRAFLEDYPRDRRGNRYRIEVDRYDNPPEE